MCCPSLPPLAFSHDRGHAANEVRRKKPPVPFWILALTGVYPEHESPTRMSSMMRIQEKHALCVQVLKQTAKHAKKVAERKLGEKKASGYIFLNFSVFIGMCKGGTVTHLSPRRSHIPLLT